MTTRETCLAALLLLTSAPALAATPINQVRPLSATGSVSIDNMKGRVVVRTWDRAEVRITGSLGEGVEKLLVEGTADDLRIQVRNPSGGGGWFGWGGNGGQAQASVIEVSMPVGASLDVETVSAGVDITGTAGRTLALETVSGDVVVRGARPAGATVETVSGDADLELQTASIAVDSVSGDIRIRGKVSGAVSIETVSGDAELTVGRVQQLDISSVSGDSRVTASLAPGGRIGTESVSGGLVLALPADTSARLRVETFSGGISSPVGKVQTEQYGPGKSLDARLGPGAGDIRLESFSGDVRIDVK